jgi:hypothetical protein
MSIRTGSKTVAKQTLHACDRDPRLPVFHWEDHLLIITEPHVPNDHTKRIIGS